MSWLVTMASQVGLVGTVRHRLGTLSGPIWVEPSATLKKLLSTVVVNDDFLPASRRPRLDPEPSYRGEIHPEPKAASPSDAVLTDGSIKANCGAAAVQSVSQFLRGFKWPQSSAQCELGALLLVINFHPPPSPVMTDSLNPFQLLRSSYQ